MDVLLIPQHLKNGKTIEGEKIAKNENEYNSATDGSMILILLDSKQLDNINQSGYNECL